MNGRSSRSFVAEGRLDAILDVILPDDVLLVQFGHNDQKPDPVGTDPWTTYRSHLRLYLEAARERDAVPVLLTPTSRCRFDDAGNADASHGFYPDAMRALAAAECVRLIDITAQTIALWQELGPDGSRRNFVETDNTHFSQPGAGLGTRMVARGLLAAGVLAEQDRAPARPERPGGLVQVREGLTRAGRQLAATRAPAVGSPSPLIDAVRGLLPLGRWRFRAASVSCARCESQSSVSGGGTVPYRTTSCVTA